MQKGTLLVLAVSVLALGFPVSLAEDPDETLMVTASDDAVADHGQPDQNFDDFSGDGRLLLTDHYSWYGDEDSRYVLLKFPNPQLPVGSLIISARVEVFMEWIDPASSGPSPTNASSYALYQVEDDWNETTVTWNTAPPLVESVANVPFTGAFGWYAFDATSVVDANVSTLSFKLRLEDPEIAYNWVHSRTLENAPRLTVEYRVPPGPPQNLRAGGGHNVGDVQLTWDAASGLVEEYRIYRLGTEGFELAGAVGGDERSFVDTHADLLKGHTYRVSAANDVGESPPSDDACARPAPLGYALAC